MTLGTGTQIPQIFEVDFGGKTVFLIDTPGFDDTFQTDADILRSVATCLSRTYTTNLKLSGIIYMHRIIDPRMTHGGMRNLAMFRKLCGDDPLKNVILATTFWSQVPKGKGEQREEELRSTPEWWGDMVAKGSKLARFDNTRDSALEIISSLIGKEKISLSIQKEMVDQGLDINKTAAGEALNAELEDLTKKFEEDVLKLHEEIRIAKAEHDIELEQALAVQTSRTEKTIENLRSQQENLNEVRREEMKAMQQEMDDRLLKAKREYDEREQMQRVDAANRLERARNEAEQRVTELMAQLDSARAEDKALYERHIADIRARLADANNNGGPKFLEFLEGALEATNTVLTSPALMTLIGILNSTMFTEF